ncbi:UNVERIFIED_ORG: hypothetical protein BDK47_11636 [Anoxybacillus amylolyticus]
MTKQEIKELVVSLVRDMKWVTYPQLLRFLLAKGVKVEGTYDLRARPTQQKNIDILLWRGLSREIVEIVEELIEENQIRVLPFPLEAYQTSEPELLKNLTIPVIRNLQEAKEGLQFFATCLGRGDILLQQENPW